jgi:hypothetical protein
MPVALVLTAASAVASWLNGRSDATTDMLQAQETLLVGIADDLQELNKAMGEALAEIGKLPILFAKELSEQTMQSRYEEVGGQWVLYQEALTTYKNKRDAGVDRKTAGTALGDTLKTILAALLPLRATMLVSTRLGALSMALAQSLEIELRLRLYQDLSDLAPPLDDYAGFFNGAIADLPQILGEAQQAQAAQQAAVEAVPPGSYPWWAYAAAQPSNRVPLFAFIGYDGSKPPYVLNGSPVAGEKLVHINYVFIQLDREIIDNVVYFGGSVSREQDVLSPVTQVAAQRTMYLTEPAFAHFANTGPQSFKASMSSDQYYQTVVDDYNRWQSELAKLSSCSLDTAGFLQLIEVAKQALETGEKARTQLEGANV